jgi:hypothetical protein
MDEYNVFIGGPERKKPLEKTRHGQVDNIIMDLIVWDGFLL